MQENAQRIEEVLQAEQQAASTERKAAIAQSELTAAKETVIRIPFQNENCFWWIR